MSGIILITKDGQRIDPEMITAVYVKQKPEDSLGNCLWTKNSGGGHKTNPDVVIESVAPLPPRTVEVVKKPESLAEAIHGLRELIG